MRRNLTDTERRMWSKLRKRRFANYKFRRQVPLGRLIVDWVCLRRRLMVELDGGPNSVRNAYEAAHTRWFERQGCRVIRFGISKCSKNTMLAIRVGLDLARQSHALYWKKL